ncbi:hypothetical protein D3C76_1381800 [compost metagenome]
MVLLLIHMPIPLDLNDDLRRQGIHDGHAHAMQAPGHFISAAAEFAPGMEHGHDDFQR